MKVDFFITGKQIDQFLNGKYSKEFDSVEDAFKYLHLNKDAIYRDVTAFFRENVDKSPLMVLIVLRKDATGKLFNILSPVLYREVMTSEYIIGRK